MFAFNLLYIITGDNMKTYIKIIIGATLIGALFAYFFYQDINSSVEALINRDDEISLFQVGVFKDYNNALNYEEKFSPSIIYNDSSYYRVIVGVAYSNEAIIKLEEFFQSEGIEYYIKRISVNEELSDSLKNYETVLLKTDSKEVIDNINNSMLQILLSYLE